MGNLVLQSQISGENRGEEAWLRGCGCEKLFGIRRGKLCKKIANNDHDRNERSDKT
jgi:hypothetical protein